MEEIPRSVFTEEFTEEATKIVIECRLSISEAARRLSIPKSTLAYWVKAAKEGKSSGISRKHTKVTKDHC